MPAIFLAFAALIVYGSLYPWVFRVPPGLDNPLLALMHARTLGLDRRFLADIVINIALYVPLGMSGHQAFRRLPNALRAALPIVFGFLLSAAVEMAQLYVPGRRCSWLDLVNNTLGAGLGVVAAMLFDAVAGRNRLQGRAHREVDRSALALLFTWAGSLLFPLFPVLWLVVYRQKMAAMLHSPVFSLLPFLSAMASWYAAGLLLRTVTPGKVWLFASVALIPAQFFIMTRLPVPAELMGAVAGIALSRHVKFRAAWLFPGLLAMRGLDPFLFGPPHGFSPVPFAGLLDMDWQTGIRVLLEKCWYSGAAIWLLHSDRMSLIRAVVAVAAVTTGIELAQVFIPGRVAEVTDPLLVLMMGFAVAVLSPKRSLS